MSRQRSTPTNGPPLALQQVIYILRRLSSQIHHENPPLIKNSVMQRKHSVKKMVRCDRGTLDLQDTSIPEFSPEWWFWNCKNTVEKRCAFLILICNLCGGGPLVGVDRYLDAVPKTICGCQSFSEHAIKGE